MIGFISESPIISACDIQINTLTNNDMPELDIFPGEPDMHFGILTLNITKTEKMKRPILFKFDIDISSSMDEPGGKGISKIKYVKNTFKNMLIYLSEETDIDIYIQVGVFNSKYSNLVDTIKVTPDNHRQIIDKVLAIRANTSTNIETTFKESGKIIDEYKAVNPEHKVAYILLTDGNATEGNLNTEYLATIIPTGCDKFCIGYGQDHCAKLLQLCGEYYFITDFEITGNVYGEIVYSLLYEALSDIVITMANGAKIYNAFTNEWTDTLEIKQLYGDKEMTYAVKCPDPENNSAIITGTIIGNPITDSIEEDVPRDAPIYLCTVEQLPQLLNMDDNTVLEVDLKKFIFRNITQQYLFNCIELSSRKHNRLENKDTLTKYIEDIRVFYRKLKKFISENNLQDDVFMKVLCDDIYTSYKTVGRETSDTFTVMRQRAHAREMSYRVSTKEIENTRDRYVQESYNGLTRQCSITNDYGDEPEYYDQEYDEQDDECQYRNDIQDHGEMDDLNRYVSSTQDHEEIYSSNTQSRLVRELTGSR